VKGKRKKHVMTSSVLSGFYRLNLENRRQRVAEITGMSTTDLEVLSSDGGLSDEQANRMAENVLGVMGLPLGLCVNMRVDDRDCLIPMATEEPSVVAAASFAAKLMRAGGGVTTVVSPPHMIGQIQLLDVPDPVAAEKAVLGAQAELMKLANSGHPHLIAAGGGAIEIEVKHLAPMAEDDPCGPMMVVHLVVDVQDAMGANAINGMCERIAPRIAELTEGRVGLRILSNLADRRTVIARCSVPFTALTGRGKQGVELARGIVEASVFAERDPYRAATHNKGIMNGIDSVLLAFGQDWRAVEAGAHAFAARNGRYTALARWRLGDSCLEGELELPMAVGTVGGVSGVHPTVKITRELASISVASELASIISSVGLAQNLAALRAMAAEGIQRGHMRLHARNVAAEAGASASEVDEVARIIADRGTVNVTAAKVAIAERAAKRKEASQIPDVYKRGGEVALLNRFSELRKEFWPAMQKTMDEVIASSTPADSTLAVMCTYHMETGGKRLRALLPLLVAEALEVDKARVVSLGAACEMLHNATLVHDDLQDGDLVRRGRMTVWNRFGVPQAINLGDAMFYFSVLLVQLLESKKVPMAKRLLVETLRVIDGQEKEFALKDIEDISLDDYFVMVEGKTSGLFALPMGGAAELCGAPADLVAGLEEAARHMGVLFQIQDDALDLFGDKGRDQVGTDIAEGKRSALVVHALTTVDETTAKRLTEIVDRERTATSAEDIAEAIEILRNAGSLDFALDEIRRRKAAALTVKTVAEHERLHALVSGMCDLFLKPIASLLDPS
jgi:hydroxymethylglutaryl-CoA reductase